MSQTKPKLLIIEDDPGVQKQLRWSLDAYDVVPGFITPPASRKATVGRSASAR